MLKKCGMEGGYPFDWIQTAIWCGVPLRAATRLKVSKAEFE